MSDGCKYCGGTELTAFQDGPACKSCFMPVDREQAASKYPICSVCEDNIIHNHCGCGDSASRLALTMQRAMGYLDIHSQLLEVAAVRYHESKSRDDGVELKRALEGWLSARKAITGGRLWEK